jgi:hypothetical protein
MDLGQSADKEAKSELPELPNTTFTVMIHWVSNHKYLVEAHQQLQALYTDVRHGAELLDFINKNGGTNEPYILRSMFKFTMQQAKLEEQYMGLYKYGQMINNSIYG